MAIITINGVPMPSPSSYKVKFADIDSSNSGRGDDGYMVRDRVRASVASIDVSWAMLKQSEADTILNALSGESMTVAYYFGGTKTATMYAKDKDAEMKAMPNGTAYWSISTGLVEL